MNGRTWTEADDAALEDLQGRPDAFAAAALARTIAAVRARRAAKGLKAYPGRQHWTRRDWLLHDAAGLDFQISLSVPMRMCTTQPTDASKL